MNRLNRPRMARIPGSSYDSRKGSRAPDGSTLTLDFTAMGALDPRITFTRADATPLATYINNQGYVTTVATAQQARFDFDPTTLVPKGLLIEFPVTNYQLSSQAFSTSLSYSDSDILSRTTGTSPSNGTAVGFYPTLVSGYHRLQYGAGVTLSGAVTVSMWFKRLNSNYRAGINAGGLIAASVIVDLNGAGSIVAIGGSAANKSATITQYQNDWYRVTLTGTYAASTSIYFFMDSSTSTDSTGGPFVGVASQGMLMWGGQIEVGSQASSYIPTTLLAVTRAADTALMTGTNFSSWYTGSTIGTFVSNWYGNASSATARSVVATADVRNRHLHMYQTPSALTLRLADFGAAATATTSNSLTAGALAKGAFSYDATKVSLCLNGGAVVPGTLAFSVAPTYMSIGGPSTDGTSITDTTVMLNNSIRSLKYFPTRLSDGQIQGLTT